MLAIMGDGRILPLHIADQVPDDDEHWENFLLLMEIVNHLFLPLSLRIRLPM